MKKLCTFLLGAMLLAIPFSGTMLAQEQKTNLKRVQMKEGKEDHPHIEAAIKALENAKHQLESAAHDFQGHRVKALDHVNEALEECHAALRADKQ